MRRFLAVSLAALTLAGCVPPPQAPEPVPAPIVTPAPRPTVPPPAPLASDWNDWPFTPGDWRYAQQPDFSTASFAMGLLTLRCDRAARQITLYGNGSGAMTVRTTSMTRSIVAKPSDRVPAVGISVFSPNDPLLDAIAFSRGRFVVEQAGQPPLVLPPYAEIGRVIEDCRG